MSRALVSALRSLVGIVAGYSLMGLIIYLVFEVGFGGVSYEASPLPVLLAAGLCAFLSAVAGAFVAAWLAGRAPFVHAAVMMVLVTLETTWLVTTGRTTDPVLFDAGAAATLLIGLACGAALYRRWRGGAAAV